MNFLKLHMHNVYCNVKSKQVGQIAYGIWTLLIYLLDFNFEWSKITLVRCKVESQILTDRHAEIRVV